MASDYFLRQIEGIGDVLSMMLFGRTADKEEIIFETSLSTDVQALLIDLRFMLSQGLINEAENLLFARIERDKGTDHREAARQFYRWLEELDEAELVRCGFSVEEIQEGRRDVERFYREVAQPQGE